MSRLLAPLIAATSSLSLRWTARESLFCVLWMRKTVKKVAIVVAVLMTSCQVFENPNAGPETSQTAMASAVRPKAPELPDRSAAPLGGLRYGRGRGCGRAQRKDLLLALGHRGLREDAPPADAGASRGEYRRQWPARTSTRLRD